MELQSFDDPVEGPAGTHGGGGQVPVGLVVPTYVLWCPLGPVQFGNDGLFLLLQCCGYRWRHNPFYGVVARGGRDVSP